MFVQVFLLVGVIVDIMERRAVNRRILCSIGN